MLRSRKRTLGRCSEFSNHCFGLCAVCVSRWRGFCKVPVDGQELSYHAKVVLTAKSRLKGRSIRVMIKLSKWQGPGRHKSTCLTVKGRLQGRAAKLLLARWKSWYCARESRVGKGEFHP
jgi:hypothetical protein